MKERNTYNAQQPHFIHETLCLIKLGTLTTFFFVQQNFVFANECKKGRDIKERVREVAWKRATQRYYKKERKGMEYKITGVHIGQRNTEKTSS
jgi:hypothetical protein